MDGCIGKHMKFKRSLASLTLVLSFGLAGSLFAASGQLILINSLGVVVNGSLGGSASNIKVQVSDSSGICSTTSSLAYGGVVVVPWNSANTHSTTKCTNIVSVDVSALKTASGVIQYDSTANPAPPPLATAPTTFIAPTAAAANIALIITGNASPAMINSATSWGSAAGIPPVYLTSNGSISVTGVMGGGRYARLKSCSTYAALWGEACSLNSLVPARRFCHFHAGSLLLKLLPYYVYAMSSRFTGGHL